MAFLRFLPVSVLLFACAGLVGCKHDIQSEQAVRQGVLNHLAKRGDLAQMDVTVTKVSFRENEANATVHFQAKGNTAPGAGLDLQYVLERKDNEWVVKNTGMMGHGAGGTGAMGGSPENPHGGGMGTPNPHGPGMMPGATGALPPGHPPVGAMPQPQQPPTRQTTPPGQSK